MINSLKVRFLEKKDRSSLDVLNANIEYLSKKIHELEYDSACDFGIIRDRLDDFIGVDKNHDERLCSLEDYIEGLKHYDVLETIDLIHSRLKHLENISNKELFSLNIDDINSRIISLKEILERKTLSEETISRLESLLDRIDEIEEKTNQSVSGLAKDDSKDADSVTVLSTMFFEGNFFVGEDFFRVNRHRVFVVKNDDYSNSQISIFLEEVVPEGSFVTILHTSSFARNLLVHFNNENVLCNMKLEFVYSGGKWVKIE